MDVDSLQFHYDSFPDQRLSETNLPRPKTQSHEQTSGNLAAIVSTVMNYFMHNDWLLWRHGKITRSLIDSRKSFKKRCVTAKTWATYLYSKQKVIIIIRYLVQLLVFNFSLWIKLLMLASNTQKNIINSYTF